MDPLYWGEGEGRRTVCKIEQERTLFRDLRQDDDQEQGDVGVSCTRGTWQAKMDTQTLSEQEEEEQELIAVYDLSAALQVKKRGGCFFFLPLPSTYTRRKKKKHVCAAASICQSRFVETKYIGKQKTKIIFFFPPSPSTLPPLPLALRSFSLTPEVTVETNK